MTDNIWNNTWKEYPELLYDDTQKGVFIYDKQESQFKKTKVESNQ